MASTPAVEWPSGEATACKAVHTGSIPVSTSSFLVPGAISSAGERFPDTEEVTGSIPVSRTTPDLRIPRKIIPHSHCEIPPCPSQAPARSWL